MKKINLREIKEVLSERELRDVKGGSESGVEKCCRCTITARFCDGGTYTIDDGLFCGHVGSTNCYHILDQWLIFYGNSGVFCGISSTDCQMPLWY